VLHDETDASRLRGMTYARRRALHQRQTRDHTTALHTVICIIYIYIDAGNADESNTGAGYDLYCFFILHFFVPIKLRA
jgi:hypothetical protein